MSQVLHPTSLKIWDLRNVGQVKPQIQAVWNQMILLSKRSMYFCSCTRARPSAAPINPIFPYLQIFLLWLNFDYMITCQLCQLRCKSATVYVLHNFSNVLAAGISPDFTWIFTDWVSAVVFPCVFSHWSKNKRHLEKTLQKMFLKTQSKICIHRALQGKMALFFNLDNSFRKIKWFV